MKPCRIALVGGGRWARVYAGLASKNPDLVGAVTIISPRNADGMRRWIAEQNLPYDVAVAPDRVEVDAAILANAAADHESSAERFLAAQIPVLIEKPFAMSAAGAVRLVELAQARGTYLAAALVFKFARYLDRFASRLPEGWDSLSVTWTDPGGESRYGERKSHDPTLPVAADVLPHVVSILDTLVPGARMTCRAVAVKRGGAQTDIELAVSGKPCVVHLARNVQKRVRRFEAIAGHRRYELDFSVEPGRIAWNGGAESGDPDWGKGASPLTLLMRSFLEGVATGGRDDRLDARLGLLACQVTDEALRLYDAALSAWLRQMFDRGTLERNDLDYAIAELGPMGAGPERPMIDQLIATLERRAESR
jgi:predicted dehydrogenase